MFTKESEMQAPSPANTTTGADGRSTEFRAVQGGETRSGEWLLVEAYAILWMILFGFILLQWKKQKALQSRIDELDKAIDRAAKKA